MLHRPSYRRQWKKKLAWYASNGVLPYDDPAAGPRVLVTSEDGVDGSISSAAIEGLIVELLG